MLLCWPPLDIWWFCRKLWGRYDMGNLFGGFNTHRPDHTVHLSLCCNVYCCGTGKFGSVSCTMTPSPWDTMPISLANDFSEFWCFNDLSVLYGKPFVVINYLLGHFGKIVILCKCLGNSCHIFLETVGYQVLYLLQFIVYICSLICGIGWGFWVLRFCRCAVC